MENETKQEGRAANIKGVSRNKNPYVKFGWAGTKKATLWDLGWLMQTQHWAGKPENMCKGKNCTAMRGEGNHAHSEECHKEHDSAAHVLALEPLEK